MTNKIYPSKTEADAKRLRSEVVRQINEDGGKVLLVTLYGSHLYGTATPNSDTDLAILYLPPLEDVLAGVAKHSYRAQTNPGHGKNSVWDVDVQASSLPKALMRFLKGETTALDLMFAATNKDAVLYIDRDFETFLKKYILNYRIRIDDPSGILGYINNQASKYGVKGTRLGDVMELADRIAALVTEGLELARISDILDRLGINPQGKHVRISPVSVPGEGGKKIEIDSVDILGKCIPTNRRLIDLQMAAERLIGKYGGRAVDALNNQGIDYKALSHAVRASIEYEQYSIQNMRFPLGELDIRLLVEIKSGGLQFSEIKKVLEQHMEIVKRLSLTNTTDAAENLQLAKTALRELYLGELS